MPRPPRQREAATIEPMKRLALVSALVVALGCGDEETCDGLNCDGLPCEDFATQAKVQKLSCACVPKYCCDTCEGNERCLGWCVDRGDSDGLAADVMAVRASGSPGAYTFTVTIRSPDTGCDRYADWWEVLTLEGELVYRRILAHSHVDERPFTRSGGPVDVEESARVVVRAHMSDGGYGGVAFAGSVASGFSADASLTAALAPELSEVPPLPSDCAF